MGFDKKIKVGISQGDINGIGYEVILKTLSDERILELCTPVIYGSSKVAIYHRKALNMPNISFNSIRSAENIAENANNMVEVMQDENPKIELGVKSEYAGKAALVALQRATEDLKSGLIDALVTAPINKHAIQGDEFVFPGHTEYLEANIGDGNKSLMILFNDRLRVALVTTHAPIAKLSEQITVESIIEKLTIFNQSLTKDFGIVKPKIAVLSLNPHAGEDGLLGDEEQNVITPAINRAYDAKICCFGPFAADGFFGSGQYKNFDGVLAMYHDQGLAPFKTLAMDSGVNFTAGLPFVRTSPDHGTGFDIAGKGEASEDSFREAIYAAIDIHRNRVAYAKMTKSPLRKMYFEKGSDNVVLDLTKVD